MANNECGCSDRVRYDKRNPDGSPVVFDDEPLSQALPTALRGDLERYLGRTAVSTLEEWAGLLRDEFGNGEITIDDLCVSGEKTPHVGVIAGEVYHFSCFYDAVILASIENMAVEISTVSPGGSIITARADGTGSLTVEPRDAVFSFGIDPEVDGSDDTTPSLQSAYTAICPYVRAFPDRSTYAEWASSVPAETVAMPLAGATELAAKLVGDNPT